MNYLHETLPALRKWAKGFAKTAVVLAAVAAPALPASAASSFERCAKAEAGGLVIGSVCAGSMAAAAPVCATAAAFFFLEPVSTGLCVAAATTAGVSCPIGLWKIIRIAAHC